MLPRPGPAPLMPTTPRKTVFDAAALSTLDELFDSTWDIVEARYPFRDMSKDAELKAELKRALFAAAEASGLDNLDALQRSVLQTAMRRTDV